MASVVPQLENDSIHDFTIMHPQWQTVVSLASLVYSMAKLPLNMSNVAAVLCSAGIWLNIVSVSLQTNVRGQY